MKKKNFLKVGGFAVAVILGVGVYTACNKSESVVMNPQNPAPTSNSQIIEGQKVTLPTRMEVYMSVNAIQVNQAFAAAVKAEMKSEVGVQYAETISKMYALYAKHNGTFIYDAEKNIGSKDEAWEYYKLKIAYKNLSEKISQAELATAMSLRAEHKYAPTAGEIKMVNSATPTPMGPGGYGCQSPLCEDGSSCTISGCQYGASCLCTGNPTTANCFCS